MGYPLTSPKIYDVLKAMEGEAVSVETMIKLTGYNRDQIMSACNNMRRMRNLPVETVIPGHSYRLRKEAEVSETSLPTVVVEETPVPQSSKRTFEEVGATRAGFIIIQDMSGQLYKAEEL